MKLIDIEDEALLKTVSLGGMSAKKLWKRIRSERKIEAIPIEWIEEWEVKQTNGEYTFELITDLLEDWRTQNE